MSRLRAKQHQSWSPWSQHAQECCPQEVARCLRPTLPVNQGCPRTQMPGPRRSQHFSSHCKSSKQPSAHLPRHRRLTAAAAPNPASLAAMKAALALAFACLLLANGVLGAGGLNVSKLLVVRLPGAAPPPACLLTFPTRYRRRCSDLCTPALPTLQKYQPRQGRRLSSLARHSSVDVSRLGVSTAWGSTTGQLCCCTRLPARRSPLATFTEPPFSPLPPHRPLCRPTSPAAARCWPCFPAWEAQLLALLAPALLLARLAPPRAAAPPEAAAPPPRTHPTLC